MSVLCYVASRGDVLRQTRLGTAKVYWPVYEGLGELNVAWNGQVGHIVTQPSEGETALAFWRWRNNSRDEMRYALGTVAFRPQAGVEPFSQIFCWKVSLDWPGMPYAPAGTYTMHYDTVPLSVISIGHGPVLISVQGYTARPAWQFHWSVSLGVVPFFPYDPMLYLNYGRWMLQVLADDEPVWTGVGPAWPDGPDGSYTDGDLTATISKPQPIDWEN